MRTLLTVLLLAGCALEPATRGTARVASAAAPPVFVQVDATLDDEPLARARLVFSGADGEREALTDDRGRAAVSLPPGVHVVTAPDLPGGRACGARRLGVFGADDDFDVVERQDPALDAYVFGSDDDPQAVKLASAWVLAGTVVDAATASPIAGATVTTIECTDGTWSMRTDVAGAFELAVPAGATGRVIAFSAPGFGTLATTICPRGHDEPDGRPVRVALRPALSLEGRVLDLEGRPLPATVVFAPDLPDVRDGETVDGWETRVTCGPDGRFALTDIALGSGDRGPNAARLQLVVGHRGHATTQEDVLVTRDAAPLEVRLDRLVPCAGRVVGPDGAPVAAAMVNWSECDPHETDAEGRFDLGLMRERARFEVCADGFGWQFFDAWLPVQDLVLRLEPVADEDEVESDDRSPFTPTRPGETSGARVSLRTWTPEPWQPPRGHVRFAIVATADEVLDVFHHRPDGTRSQSFYSHGEIRRTFSIHETTLGAHAVEVRARGHAPAVRRFEVREGQDLTLEPLRLEPGGGTFELRVRWPDAPVAGLRLRFVDPVTGFEVEEWADPPGLPDVPCHVGPIGAGEVTVHPEWFDGDGKEHAGPPFTVTTHDHATTPVELDLR